MKYFKKHLKFEVLELIGNSHIILLVLMLAIFSTAKKTLVPGLLGKKKIS